MIGMSILPTVELWAMVREHPEDPDRMFIEERQYLVIQEICRGERGLLRVDLGKAGVAMSVKGRLLVNPANPFDKANVARILGNEQGRVRTLHLPIGSFSFLASSRA